MAETAPEKPATPPVDAPPAPAAESPAGAPPGPAPAKPPRPPEGWFLSLDLLVVVGAVLLLAAGYVVHGALTRPRLASFSRDALTVRYPAEFALREPLQPPASGPMTLRLRRAGDATSEIEIQVARRPVAGSIRNKREMDRAATYGTYYQPDDSSRRLVGGKEWLRTSYHYVSAAGRPTSAVEYAYPADLMVNGDKIYVVSIHGAEPQLRALEAQVLGSLTVQ